MFRSSGLKLLAIVVVLVRPVMASADSAVSSRTALSSRTPPKEQPTDYEFSLDAQLRPRMGAEDLTSAFRLVFWEKDLLLDRLAGPHRIPSLVWGPALRLVELAFIDTPLAISTQTFAHEAFGHGGRIREFGGTASYVWKPPFPYSMESSYYEQRFMRPLTADEQTLIPQGGLALEGFQREQVIHSAFESGTWSHGDAVDYFAWSLHLAGYGALHGGDVTNWTQVMAERYGLRQPDVQRSYLISAALAELLDPVFLYSVYAIFDRFLVFGERTAPLPTIRLWGVPVGISTHLDPTPWGMEYQVDVLARTSLALFSLAPRVGAGPGGGSGGLTMGLRGLRLGRHVRLVADVDLWIQPQLNVFSEGVLLGQPPTSPPGMRSPTSSSTPRYQVGGDAHAELVYEQDHWLAGFRVGAKTAGLSGMDPIAPALETTVVVGLRLE